MHLHPDVVMVPPLGGKKQLDKDRGDVKEARKDQARFNEFEEFDEFNDGSVKCNKDDRELSSEQ